MQTMLAVRMHRYGGPDVLFYEEVPRPRPEEGELLVRVEAAAVNPVDWKIREGYLREMLHHSLPLIMGWDVQPDAAVLTELAKLVDAGKLRTYLEAVLPLVEAPRGQEMSQAGHVRGKIVLKVV